MNYREAKVEPLVKRLLLSCRQGMMMTSARLVPLQMERCGLIRAVFGDWLDADLLMIQNGVRKSRIKAPSCRYFFVHVKKQICFNSRTNLVYFFKISTILYVGGGSERGLWSQTAWVTIWTTWVPYLGQVTQPFCDSVPSIKWGQ